MSVSTFNCGIIASAGASGPVFTLSGETTGSGGDTWAQIEFRTDGTVWESDSGASATQVSAGSDWVIPNSESSNDYDIWVEKTGTDGGGSMSGDTLGTWLALSGTGSANRAFKYSNSGGQDYQRLQAKIRMGVSPFTELTAWSSFYQLQAGTVE